MQPEPLNPYESPREAGLARPPSPRKQLIARLRGPSIGLLVLSGLQAFTSVSNFAMTAIMFLVDGKLPVFNGQFQFEIVIAAVAFAPSLVIFAGAWQMRRMRSLQLCRVAAITACIPFLSPVIILGIPLGIWAAAVLFQKSTAEEFERPAEE